MNHDILLKKLDYYGIRGITNSSFPWYLNDRMQFITLNKWVYIKYVGGGGCGGGGFYKFFKK